MRMSEEEYQQLMTGRAVKKPKYRNIRTESDGIKFDSKKEATYYETLKLRERAGEITNLELQPRFRFDHNGIHIGSYVGDFSHDENGERIVTDVKSPATRRLALYRWKKKMMKAYFGIEITEA